MKKLFLPLLFLVLSISSTLSAGEINNSPYDWMSQELLKINSANTPYVESVEPFAPLVNAFIADARDDKETLQKKFAPT